eukprot:s2743_g11.t1
MLKRCCFLTQTFLPSARVSSIWLCTALKLRLHKPVESTLAEDLVHLCVWLNYLPPLIISSLLQPSSSIPCEFCGVQELLFFSAFHRCLRLCELMVHDDLCRFRMVRIRIGIHLS